MDCVVTYSLTQTQINRFPNSGCEAAFRSGREFADECMPLTDLPTALSFCDNAQEQIWFLLGIDYERNEVLIVMKGSVK